MENVSRVRVAHATKSNMLSVNQPKNRRHPTLEDRQTNNRKHGIRNARIVANTRIVEHNDTDTQVVGHSDTSTNLFGNIHHKQTSKQHYLRADSFPMRSGKDKSAWTVADTKNEDPTMVVGKFPCQNSFGSSWISVRRKCCNVVVCGREISLS